MTHCAPFVFAQLSVAKKKADESKEDGAEEEEKLVDGTLKTLRTNDAFEIMKIIRQRRKKRGSVSTNNLSTKKGGGAGTGSKHGRNSSKREMLQSRIKESAAE